MDVKKLALLNSEEKAYLTYEPASLMVISIKPEKATEREFHRENQVFYCVQGIGFVRFSNSLVELKEGVTVAVKGFEDHSIINAGENDLKLWSMYY